MSLASIFDMGDDTKPKALTGVNLVDFSQIVISTLMATFKPGEEITVDIMRHLCLNTIRANVLKNKKLYPTIVICVDNAKDGYWRRDFAAYYKKNRSAGREKSEWDWETIFHGMHTVVSELKEHMPYIVVDKTKTEADDVIGVLCKHLNDNYPSCKVMITSSDGDFTQLHKFPNVKQWSPIQKKWVQCKHGSPRNDLRYKIVKGDKKDAVAGINVRSDYVISKLEGERAKPISTEKFLNPILKADNPLELDLMTDEQKLRYAENEVLLDFEKIPDHIREPIIDQFENVPAAPRRKIYPYFVSRRLVKLLESVNDF